MKELNTVLTELGISKVRLSKYLGVSRQMLYNYLSIDDINNWPKEKAAKLLSLLNIENVSELKKLFKGADATIDAIKDTSKLVKNIDKVDDLSDTIKGVSKANGIEVYDGEREFIDGISGLWTMMLGHNNKELLDSIIEQFNKVEFVNPWTSCSQVAYDLAKEILEFTNKDFSKVMYTCSGSESIA